jgi:hypothetical protein
VIFGALGGLLGAVQMGLQQGPVPSIMMAAYSNTSLASDFQVREYLKLVRSLVGLLSMRQDQEGGSDTNDRDRVSLLSLVSKLYVTSAV